MKWPGTVLCPWGQGWYNKTDQTNRSQSMLKTHHAQLFLRCVAAHISASWQVSVANNSWNLTYDHSLRPPCFMISIGLIFPCSFWRNKVTLLQVSGRSFPLSTSTFSTLWTCITQGLSDCHVTLVRWIKPRRLFHATHTHNPLYQHLTHRTRHCSGAMHMQFLTDADLTAALFVEECLPLAVTILCQTFFLVLWSSARFLP